MHVRSNAYKHYCETFSFFGHAQPVLNSNSVKLYDLDALILRQSRYPCHVVRVKTTKTLMRNRQSHRQKMHRQGPTTLSIKVFAYVRHPATASADKAARSKRPSCEGCPTMPIGRKTLQESLRNTVAAKNRCMIIMRHQNITT